MPFTRTDFQLKFLVIAGQSQCRSQLVNLLVANPYQIQLTDTGDEGLQSASTFHPDLIFINIKLPDNDGYTITQQLQNNPITQSIPIILMGDSKDIFSQVRALKLSVADVLIWPFDGEELQFRIEMQLLRLRDPGKKIGDRQGAEQQLHKVKRQLELLIGNSPLGMVILDSNFHIIQWSKRAEEIFGWSEAEVLGNCIHDWQFVFTEDSYIVNQEIEKIFKHKEYQGIFRNRNYHKDGSVVYCEWYNSLLYNESGELTMLLSLVQDVSEQQAALIERKKTEIALTESENRFRDIASVINLFFFVQLANSDQYVYVSPAYEKIWGCSCESLYQNPNSWLDAIHPDDRAMVDESLKEHDQKHQVQREYRIIRPDGSIRWIATEINTIYDQDGSPLRYIGFAEDISDRKQAELALAENEQIFREIAATVSQFFFVKLAKSGEYIYVSPAYEKIWGCSCESLYQNPNSWLDFIHGDDRQQVLDSLQKQSQNQLVKREYRIIRPDGVIRWISAEVNIIYDQDGSPLRYIGFAEDISDRKQAELALAESENRFQEIASTISQLFFVRLDSTTYISGEHIYVSPAYEKIWGRSCESLRQNPDSWLDAIHPDDRESVINSLHTPYPKHPLSREYRIIRPDGSIRWISSEVNVIYSQDGSPLRYVGLAEDISDRKQTEIALAESEELLRLAVNHAPDIFVIYDSDRRFKYVNQRLLQRTGWSAETFIGHRDEDIFPPEVTSAYLPLLEKTIQTLDLQMGEVTIQYKDKDPYTIIAKYLPVLDKQGKISLILGLTFDITQYKQAEQKLRESEERFRTFFEDAAIGMALLSLQGKWLKVNYSMEEMLGYTEAELLQLVCQDITYPEDYQWELKLINQLLNGEIEYYHIDKRYIHKKGYMVWVLLSISLVKNIDGVPLYFIAQAQNISERRAVEQMKNEFISMVSHELRTPLTSIQGSLGLLSSGLYDKKPQEFRRFIEIALLDTERLVRLVNDILNIERLESGKVKFKMEVCSANELMIQVVDSLQTMADSASINLEMLPTSAQVWAAPDAILQTLTNLVGNAIKFSPPNTTVTLSAYPQGNLIQFQVSDRGRGIPSEQLENIFSRFHQVDSSDSRQKGGTGLGLAICQSIIEQHGGKIWAESELGKGSSFYFTLSQVTYTK